ncbi:MAG: glycerol-3-phosphate 1-O-acyltransferase PlsY [Candidatus Dormibacteraeota bacterium]|nr:glycerol-3-phosphate 1-O-acyltransferase PlsY [Candidatus Dormibacteraeota bacterium]MBV9525335.1 glycerol-3-phosphate 1-O-acyltransferase PlsY [Candidatus Dormibacteraeota bacterium]
MRGRFADVAATAGGYLIGSIPVGVLLGRALRGLDVREHGSGSMGTTNVLRLVGPAAAATTFALDVGKGSAAVLLARRLGADRGGQGAAGLAAVVGHSWPALARFRGGKGVATAFGALLFVSADASAFAVAGGLSALALTRIMSVGSLSAAASAVLGAGVEEARTGDRAPLAFAGLAAGLIALRHAGNIRRLLRGAEPQVTLRRKNRS